MITNEQLQAKKLDDQQALVQRLLLKGGMLRLDQIVRNKKTGYPGVIPVARTTWLAGVKSGKYPQPVKLTKTLNAWKVDDLLKFVEQA